MKRHLLLASLSASLLAGAAVGQTVQPPLSQRPSPIPVPEQGPTAPPPTPGAPKDTAEKKPSGGLDLDKLETNDLSLVFFAPSETYLTPHIARSFENSFAFQRRTFGWTPWERTTVLLKDFADYGNAAARATPNNALLIDVAPLSQTYETFSAGERFYTLMNHEMVHVATMDVWNSRDAAWRRLFHGKPLPLSDHPESIAYNYLTAPRTVVPRWYLEGSAVFMETWMAGGYGRAQGGYDEMAFRAKVRDHGKFYSPLGLESEGIKIDFQGGVNDYLYGTRFFTYLALTYTPQKVIEWLRRDEDSKAYYSVNFQHVFGKSLDTAWNEWIAFEKGFQAKNLASVGAYALTPLQKLSPAALGSISRSFYDPAAQTLIGGFSYPGVIAHIGELSLPTGRVKHIVDIKGPMLYRVTSTAYDPTSQTLWYNEDNYAYRDIIQLDLKTGQRKMVVKDARIGDLVFNPADKSLWGVRHLNGLVTLVTMEAPYTTWRQVHTFDYGEIAFDPDISPDGKTLSVSFGKVDGDQSVRLYDLAGLDGPEIKPKAEFRLKGATPEGFVFAPDGKSLYGSAYYTGVSNIYRYDIASGDVAAVSNTDTGLFRPIPQADGSVIAYQYTGLGFQPVRFTPKALDDLGTVTFLGTEVAKTQPIVKTWAVGSPAKIPLESMITEEGKYIPSKKMTLDSLYPIVEGYKNGVAVGLNAIVEDPLQLNQLTAAASYSPGGNLKDSERFHADVQYRTVKWRFEYWHNDANFYDLFGPTDRSRKGDAFIGVYKTSPIYDPPRQLDLTATAAAYFGLDTLPGAQNVSAVTDRDIYSTALSLRYNDDRKSQNSIDYERGMGWNIDGGVDYAASGAFPKLRVGGRYGVPVLLPHASIFVYGAAGAAGGSSANPLSRYYFGSFGNNYVDDGEVKRYREYDSFPGFRIDEISAKNFGKAIVELNLPPARFSDIGKPSFYLASARTALFAGVLAADPGRGGVHDYENLGAQVDFGFTVALRLPMVLSLGYAAGFDRGDFHHNEFLFSIKIL